MSYRVGRGLADITGEAAECGMLGYGKARQRTNGLHMRLRSRAFVIIDDSGGRVMLSVNDLPMIFDSVRVAVLGRLAERHGDAFTERNVLMTATHTHCAPGGYSYHRLYNSNTGGFRPLTFTSIVDGMVEAAEAAIADVAPADLRLAHGRLRNASINRSRAAFDRNPPADRAMFPDAIDPQVTVLGVEKEGLLVGAVSWFATHGTSMTNRNRLISSDNKGYAAYRWEKVEQGVDYLDDQPPGFVGAFAQTNAGDMSPNLHRRPGSGPTEDEFANTRIIGERQFEAAVEALDTSSRRLDGQVDARLAFIGMVGAEVAPQFSGDGAPHRTGTAFGGAAALAGTDEGPAFRAFRQGSNPLLDRVSSMIYRLRPALAATQAPKALVVPGTLLNRLVPLAQDRVPVQLLRIGALYLIGIPGEVTIVAGLRLRRTVAEIVGAEIEDVLVAGYSNSYIHYVTTPEEYDAQRYEGGSTMFGRWELGLFQQTAAALAGAMRDGRQVETGDPPPQIPEPRPARTRRRVDEAPTGHRVGDVLIEPRKRYQAGEQVHAVFAGAHPNNRLRRGGTYLAVERRAGERWVRVADDGDWATKLRWRRSGRDISEITITWDIPGSEEDGEYRIRYFGDARTITEDGPLSALEATTRPFTIGRAGQAGRHPD